MTVGAPSEINPTNSHQIDRQVFTIQPMGSIINHFENGSMSSVFSIHAAKYGWSASRSIR